MICFLGDSDVRTIGFCGSASVFLFLVPGSPVCYVSFSLRERTGPGCAKTWGAACCRGSCLHLGSVPCNITIVSVCLICNRYKALTRRFSKKQQQNTFKKPNAARRRGSRLGWIRGGLQAQSEANADVASCMSM